MHTRAMPTLPRRITVSLAVAAAVMVGSTAPLAAPAFAQATGSGQDIFRGGQKPFGSAQQPFGGARKPSTAAPSGNVIRVCKTPMPGQACNFTSIAKALAAVPSGGMVVIGPGVYTEGGVLRASGVRIVGERGAHLKGALTHQKASLVIQGRDTTVQGIRCSEVKNLDGNGACIRQEAPNLTVRGVYFHDSQQGLLGGLNLGTVLVENSRFERLGWAGLAHGMYVGRADTLIVRKSVILRSVREGHEIKSRAARTIIENNVIASLDGQDSRLIDIPNGGEIIIRNNILAMGAASVNPQAIGIGLELKGTTVYPRNSTLIENNVILLERPGKNQLIHSQNVPPPVITNNLIIGSTPPGTGNAWYPNRAAAGLPPYPALKFTRSAINRAKGR